MLMERRPKAFQLGKAKMLRFAQGISSFSKHVGIYLREKLRFMEKGYLGSRVGIMLEPFLDWRG